MVKEIQLHEFPKVGKYRVRIVRNVEENGPATLDVREYISSREFEGFTRRGIRLATTKEVMELRDNLTAVLAMLEVKS